MKKLLIFGFLLSLFPTVFADAGDCYTSEYGMMGSWGIGGAWSVDVYNNRNLYIINHILDGISVVS